MPIYRSAVVQHWRTLHTPDSILELTRDGSNEILLKEKTSGEVAIRIGRVGTNRYALRCNLTPGMGIRLPVANFTIDNTVDENIFFVLLDASAGVRTAYLLAPGTRPGSVHAFKKIDASANAGVVNAAGTGGTIDGAASVSLPNQYDGIVVQCDGSNWHIIART